MNLRLIRTEKFPSCMFFDINLFINFYKCVQPNLVLWLINDDFDDLITVMYHIELFHVGDTFVKF